MRSPIRTTVIVLLAASAVGGNAFAATQPGTIEHVGTSGGSVKIVRPQTKMSAHPRLRQILAELRLQNKRINRDHRQGHLTLAAAEHLKADRNIIRNKALHVAALHGGKLPARPYHALQASVKHLNGNIRRMLTA